MGRVEAGWDGTERDIIRRGGMRRGCREVHEAEQYRTRWFREGKKDVRNYEGTGREGTLRDWTGWNGRDETKSMEMGGKGRDRKRMGETGGDSTE